MDSIGTSSRILPELVKSTVMTEGLALLHTYDRNGADHPSKSRRAKWGISTGPLVLSDVEDSKLRILWADRPIILTVHAFAILS